MNILVHISSLRDRLAACPATNKQISQAAENVISESWVSKFRAGHVKNPRADSLVALEQALTSVHITAEDREAA